MARRKPQILRRRALRLDQDGGHPLYLFALTGEEILSIADISRISRDDADHLIGYQRPEVRQHVQDIVDYLDSDNILFPNAIILALSSRVKFTRSRGPQIHDDGVSAGILDIPLSINGQEKPAWIVDGQQRTLALSKSTRKALSVPVSGFVADEIDLQRDQFIRVNNQRPLPRGLLTELLPEIVAPLPAKLAARKIPTALCEWLSTDEESPFHGLIKRASMSKQQKRKAIISDAAIVSMIGESLNSPSGALFPYRNVTTKETDFAGIGSILFIYWQAVKETFPEAWGKPPTKSRLMHGAGIRAMGGLMDRIMGWHRPVESDPTAHAMRELARIAPICRWTHGHWDELGLEWNEIQNVSRHIRVLTDVLVRNYVQRQGIDT
jgi:DGQHR domain-containing protein